MVSTALLPIGRRGAQKVIVYFTQYSPTAQPSITIEFAEIDFEEVESAGDINVTVTANGESPVDLKLIITPFTFDEYASQFGRNLPTELQVQSEGLDRAECESTFRNTELSPQFQQESV